MSSFVSSHSNGSNPTQPSFVCSQIPLVWEEAHKIACSSVGKISANGQDLGCGVLIGIDRMLVPAHAIANHCSDHLQVTFYSSGVCCCYWVLTFFVDKTLDLAVLQLDRSCGHFPGQIRCFPSLSADYVPRDFLLGNFDKYVPSSTLLQGYPCYEGNFCSFSSTEHGSSGSGYFNQYGELFALHLARSNDFCAGVPRGERKAVLVSQMKNSPQLAWIFLRPLCQPLPPPRVPAVCAGEFEPPQMCFVAQGGAGGRPAIPGEIEISGRKHQFWEYKPKNPNGKGPRGLTISIPHMRQKVTYLFKEQVHGISAYNKRQEEVYQTAAKAFKAAFEVTQSAPEILYFQIYSGWLEAEKSWTEKF